LTAADRARIREASHRIDRLLDGQSFQEALAAAGDEDDNPPREVLEAMVEAELTPVPGTTAIISESEVKRAVRRLREVLPEIFEE